MVRGEHSKAWVDSIKGSRHGTWYVVNIARHGIHNRLTGMDYIHGIVVACPPCFLYHSVALKHGWTRPFEPHSLLTWITWITWIIDMDYMDYYSLVACGVRGGLDSLSSPLVLSPLLTPCLVLTLDLSPSSPLSFVRVQESRSPSLRVHHVRLVRPCLRPLLSLSYSCLSPCLSRD